MERYEVRSIIAWVLLIGCILYSPLHGHQEYHCNKDYFITPMMTNIPYLKEVAFAGTLAYSAVSFISDLVGINLESDSLSSPICLDSNPTDYSAESFSSEPLGCTSFEAIEEFPQFRSQTIKNRPFIPGRTTKYTVYENFSLYTNPEYRKFLKTFPEYSSAIITLAQELRDNPKLLADTNSIVLPVCEQCSGKKLEKTLTNWIFDEEYRLLLKQLEHQQNSRCAQVEYIVHDQKKAELLSLTKDASYIQKKESIIDEQKQIAYLYNQFELDAYHQRLLCLAHSSLDQALDALDDNNHAYLYRCISRKNALLKTVAELSKRHSRTISIDGNTVLTIGKHIDLEPYKNLNGTELDHEINNETLNIFQEASTCVTEYDNAVYWESFPQVIGYLGQGIRANRMNKDYLYSFNLLDITHGIIKIAAKSVYNGCGRIISSLIDHPIETLADTVLLVTLPNVAMTKFICSLTINHEAIGLGIEQLCKLIVSDPEEGLSQAGGFLFEMFVVHKGFVVGQRHGPSIINSLKKGISSIPRSRLQSRSLFRSLKMKLPQLEAIGYNLRNSITTAMRQVDGWAEQLNNVVYESLQLESLALAEQKGQFKISSPDQKKTKTLEKISEKSNLIDKKITAENVTMRDVLERLKPSSKLNPKHQLQAVLDDGSKVIIRRDIGEYAHSIGKKYLQKTPHYNIEIHKPKPPKWPGDSINYKVTNKIHIILDKNMKPIDIF